MKNINPLPSMRDWYAEHFAAAPKVAKSRTKAPVVKTPCTPDELRAIKAIGSVTYCPGIGTKRFARDIQGATELTDAQRLYLWQVCWRYRRQIADKTLVKMATECVAEMEKS
jgi:hypothetical protein